ncbi:MAG TPA: ATP-binding protein, partial [Thermoguttaceae bacterium]|nr:ATP-binding protein [Thermoguttaceae bacterium]
GTLPQIAYDRTHLTQLFQNLVSNAIKHMGKPNGQIVISSREIDGDWEFSVRDTGVGIEEKHFDRIFKIFQSLKPRDEVEATGIGLSLVKAIAEKHGGIVRIESKLGEGSTFSFTVPKHDITSAGTTHLNTGSSNVTQAVPPLADIGVPLSTTLTAEVL